MRAFSTLVYSCIGNVVMPHPSTNSTFYGSFRTLHLLGQITLAPFSHPNIAQITPTQVAPEPVTENVIYAHPDNATASK